MTEQKRQRRRPGTSLGDALRRRADDPRDQKLQIYVDMATYDAIVRHKIRTGRPASAFLAEMIAAALAREEEIAAQGVTAATAAEPQRESAPAAAKEEPETPQEPRPALPPSWARRSGEDEDSRRYLNRLKNGRKSAWADIRKNRERWERAGEDGREQIRAAVAHIAARMAGWQGQIAIVEPELGAPRTWHPADVVEFLAELGIEVGDAPVTEEEPTPSDRPGLLAVPADEEPEQLDDEEI